MLLHLQHAFWSRVEVRGEAARATQEGNIQSLKVYQDLESRQAVSKMTGSGGTAGPYDRPRSKGRVRGTSRQWPLLPEIPRPMQKAWPLTCLLVCRRICQGPSADAIKPRLMCAVLEAIFSVTVGFDSCNIRNKLFGCRSPTSRHLLGWQLCTILHPKVCPRSAGKEEMTGEPAENVDNLAAVEQKVGLPSSDLEVDPLAQCCRWTGAFKICLISLLFARSWSASCLQTVFRS